MAKRYDETFKAKVVKEVQAGATRKAVAKKYKINPVTVTAWLEQSEKTASTSTQTKKKTTPKNDLVNFARELFAETGSPFEKRDFPQEEFKRESALLKENTELKSVVNYLLRTRSNENNRNT